MAAEAKSSVFEAHRAFAAVLSERGSLLALDVSKRRVGLAGTDPLRRLVTPLDTLNRGDERQLYDRLERRMAERQVAGLVVGWPLNMDGSRGPMAEAAERFARDLCKRTGLPVLLQDERLTTFAIEDAIEQGRLPRPRKKGEPLDHYAAAVILEDALRAIRSDGGK